MLDPESRRARFIRNRDRLRAARGAQGAKPAWRLDGVSFASPEASAAAISLGLHASHFSFPASGARGFTISDVKRAWKAANDG